MVAAEDSRVKVEEEWMLRWALSCWEEEDVAGERLIGFVDMESVVSVHGPVKVRAH